MEVSDFSHLVAKASPDGVGIFLDQTYGEGRATFIGLDASEKKAMIQTPSGEYRNVEMSMITNFLKTRAMNMAEADSVNLKQNVAVAITADLKDIGIGEMDIVEGHIHPKKLEWLEENGYPIKDIKRDMQRLRIIRGLEVMQP